MTKKQAEKLLKKVIKTEGRYITLGECLNEIKAEIETIVQETED